MENSGELSHEGPSGVQPQPRSSNNQGHSLKLSPDSCHH